jgi:hypothetical protein
VLPWVSQGRERPTSTFFLLAELDKAPATFGPLFESVFNKAQQQRCLVELSEREHEPLVVLMRARLLVLPKLRKSTILCTYKILQSVGSFFG